MVSFGQLWSRYQQGKKWTEKVKEQCYMTRKDLEGTVSGGPELGVGYTTMEGKV